MRREAGSNIQSFSKCHGVGSRAGSLSVWKAPTRETECRVGDRGRPDPSASRSSLTTRQQGSPSSSRNEKGPSSEGPFSKFHWEPLGYHHAWVETGIPAGERLHPAWALLR